MKKGKFIAIVLHVIEAAIVLVGLYAATSGGFGWPR